MTPRYVKHGEALAMYRDGLHSDRKGFFWMMGSGALPNERKGDTMIVHVRGELEHHKADAYGGAESYEGIRERFAWALAGQVDGDSDADDAPATQPKCVVLVIDSPGGVVAGLNETVAALQRMRKDNPEVRTIAYCNEMAASAAYAIACSCETIIAPPSAIIGSIGVISTMVSQAAKDKRDGYDVRLLTSGARKADGHAHAPLTDAAVNVETGRVQKLAEAFFRIVSRARSLPVEKIRALQAGIYLGKDAKRVGLIDEVKSLDDVLAGAEAAKGAIASGGNETDRKVRMDLKALIKKTQAALATEKDPKKLLALAANLEAYKKTEKHIEHTKTEEGADEGEESEESAEESEEESAASEEEEKADLPSKDDDSDDEDDEPEDKKGKKSASLATLERLTGKRGRAALGAAEAVFASHAAMSKDVADLKAARTRDAKSNAIAEARAKNQITGPEAKKLAAKSLAFVEGWLEMRRESGFSVTTDEASLVKAKAPTPGAEGELPADVLASIESTVSAVMGGRSDKDRATFRAQLVSANIAAMKEAAASSAANGAAGRY